MAKGNDILSYSGDAASGFASDADALDVYGVIDAQPLGELVRNIAMTSFERNRMIYQQKIRERDKAYEMLDDEGLVLNNILEQHRPLLDEKISAVRKIFMDSGGDIMSNPETYRNFQSAIKDAKDHIKQAQKKFLGVEAELKERSKVGNPIDQGKYDSHITKELGKDFWSMYTPYAPMTDYSLEIVAPAYKTISRTYEDGLYNVTETLPDAQATINAYRGNFFRNEYNHMFPKYVNDMLSAPNSDEMVEKVQAGLEKNGIEKLRVKKDRFGNWVLDGDDYGTAAAKIKLSEATAQVKRELDGGRSNRDIQLRKIAADERDARNRNALGWAQLNWDKNKWQQQTKGTETQKNGAMVFAQKMFNDIKGLAFYKGAGNTRILTPNEIRKLTAEQLKYLGLEGETESTDSDGVKTKKSGLLSLKLEPTEVLVLEDNGTIRVMKDAVNAEGRLNLVGGRLFGTFDNTRSTSISNIATNRLNEELRNSGTKELNNYLPLDSGGGGISQSGSSANGNRGRFSGPSAADVQAAYNASVANGYKGTLSDYKKAAGIN